MFFHATGDSAFLYASGGSGGFCFMHAVAQKKFFYASGGSDSTSRLKIFTVAKIFEILTLA